MGTPDVNTKGNAKPEMLALLFVFIIILPLGLVAYVNANWETTTTEQVWVSDDDAIVPHEKFDFQTPLVDYKGNFTTASRIKATQTYLNDSTPLPAGNDTWVASWDGTGLLDLTPSNNQHMIFEIPNANTFLINEVDFEFYLGQGVNPDLVRIELLAVEIDGEVDTGADNADEDIIASYVIHSQVLPTNDWDNGTAQVSLAVALDIIEKAKLDAVNIYMKIIISDQNGWSLHDTSYRVAINGTYQSRFSTANVVYMILGAGAVINVGAMIFMTDTVDWKDVVKALRPSKRGKRKGG